MESHAVGIPQSIQINKIANEELCRRELLFLLNMQKHMRQFYENEFSKLGIRHTLMRRGDHKQRRWAIYPAVMKSCIELFKNKNKDLLIDKFI